MGGTVSKLNEIAIEILGVPILAGLMLCFMRCYQHILKRGYYWYTASLGCALSLGAGFAIAFSVTNPLSADVTFVLVATVSSSAIACFLPALFPIKSKRRAGPRRILWKRTQVVSYGFAAACGAASAMITGWEVMRPKNIQEPWTNILLPLEGAGLGLIIGWVAGKRGRIGRDLSDTVKEDTRPPVLYLREFGDERRPFVTQASDKWPHIPAQLGFEGYMQEAIEAVLGPLVALGNPADYMAPPGAARDYAEDGDWHQRFLQLAVSAQAIVLSPGASGSLRWELDCLLRSSMATKLFVVLGPDTFETLPASQVYAWAERFIGFPASWKPVNWEQFRQTMAELGYVLPSEPPMPPAVIAFDWRAHAVVLPGLFLTPREVVAAIKGYRALFSPEWQDAFSKLFSGQ
jgi:hypothetical protein